MTKERWKVIPGFTAYRASSLGRIESCTRVLANGRRRKGRILRLKVNQHGYAEVTLRKNNISLCLRVAFLVLFTFKGPRPRGKEVAHKNGQSLDDRAVNLKWATHRENEHDKIAHGTVPFGLRNGKYTKPEATPRGEKHGQARFTARQVRRIRKLAQTVPSRKLARQFGVSKTAILFIKNRVNWAHLK